MTPRNCSPCGAEMEPLSPELPHEALLVTAKIESFAWRVEQLVQEGGFALISGESGTGSRWPCGSWPNASPRSRRGGGRRGAAPVEKR